MNYYFISLLLFFGFFNNAISQNYADKNYYLVDSLEVDSINIKERKVLDSCLFIFHATKVDTSKVNAIDYIVESSYDNKLWPKYNTWIYDFSSQQLTSNNNANLNSFYYKAKAGAINNFGYFSQIYGKNTQAIKHYTASLDIYKQINDTIGLANALNNIGSVHYYSGDIIESLRLYHESLNYRKLIGDDYGIANSLNNIGNIYRIESNYTEAIEYFLESLKYRLVIKNESYISTLNHNIGVCYMDLDDIENALIYLNKALESDTKASNTIGIAKSLKIIGHCYQKTNKNEKALEQFKKSLTYFKKAGSQKEIGSTINALAETKLALNHNTTEILNLYNQSFTIFNSEEYPEGLEATYSGLAKVSLKNKDLVTARSFAEKFLALAQRTNSKTQTKNALLLLAEISEKQRAFKDALAYSKLASVLNDSINKALSKNAIDIKQVKFKYEQDLLLSENNLKHKISLVETKNKSQRRTIIITLIGLSLISILLIVLYNKLKTNRAQKKEIKLQNDSLNDMYIELQSAFDDKTFLLKEIHHRVKNNLQVISSILRMQNKHTDDPKVKELLKNSQSRINSMALIHEKLYKVDDLSLIDYNNYINELVTILIKTYNKDGGNIDFKFNSDPLKITIETAIPLGLLLNEIISNTLKHAFKKQKEREIYLDISVIENNRYKMLIGDNGVGDSKYLNDPNNDSLGLKLIHIMVKQLNGSIEQETQKKGTHYKIIFEAIKRDRL